MESIKKPYKPKPDKVEKLEKVYKEIKASKPVKSFLFAKAVVLMVLLSSCSAQWHLKQACKKDGAICKPQVIKLDTIIYTDSVEIYETFETEVHDTIIIDTGSVRVEIYRDHDIIRTYIKQRPDTIKITKTVNVPQVIMKENDWNPWVILIALISILLWLIKKF
jgi:hypothetical protein